MLLYAFMMFFCFSYIFLHEHLVIRGSCQILPTEIFLNTVWGFLPGQCFDILTMEWRHHSNKVHLFRWSFVKSLDCPIREGCGKRCMPELFAEPTLSSPPKKAAHFFHTSFCKLEMEVSENSVPLNPMVNDHYPY